jgi:two-component system response regulator MtrA
MPEKILLIEDDEALSRQVAQQLTKLGFAVTCWHEGRLLRAHERLEYALVILDLMLPGTYGLDVLKDLRSTSDVPVLVLSARNESSDKVRALKLGADDYLSKPFWPEELAERVRARLRRPTMQKQSLISVGALRIELEGREARVGATALELTRVEFDILAALARRAGSAITRQWLAENVLDPEREGNERTLDVHLSRLRRKLGDATLIETVWGVGYRLRAGGHS